MLTKYVTCFGPFDGLLRHNQVNKEKLCVIDKQSRSLLLFTCALLLGGCESRNSLDGGAVPWWTVRKCAEFCVWKCKYACIRVDTLHRRKLSSLPLRRPFVYCDWFPCGTNVKATPIHRKSAWKHFHFLRLAVVAYTDRILPHYEYSSPEKCAFALRNTQKRHSVFLSLPYEAPCAAAAAADVRCVYPLA